MAYKALYRTYRPQSFDEMAGQEHIITTLKNAIKENRIAHAYLFAGPRGTGKTTVAKILAKAINCTSENRPCGVCDNCVTISDGSNPDVIEIDAASNNGVDEVRDLIDKVKYAPIKGNYKVYIIDEVHMMSTGAFNALLKTLEEPPAHIVFILATTEPHKILPTIISRCQRFDFTKVDDNDIIDRLEYVLKQENMEYEVAALTQIAKLAEGGMRDALSILEQCLAYSDQLTLKNVQKVYGLLSVELKLELILHLLSKDTKKVLEDLEQLLSNSVDIRHLTYDLIDVLKDIIIYKNTKDISSLFVLNQKDIDKIVPYILVDEAFEMIDILVDASMHYSQTLNANTYFEIALLKISNHVKDENKITLQRETVVVSKQEVEEVEPETIVEDNEEPEELIEETINELIIEDQEPIPQEDVIETTEEEPIEGQMSLFSFDEEVMKPEVQETIDQPIEEVNDEASLEVEQAQPLVEELQEEIVDEEVVEFENTVNELEVLESDIVNILVQAQRYVLEDVKERWEVISRYRYNLNTAKEATMLCDGSPVAAAPNAVVIAFDHLPQVNVVNDPINHQPLKLFLREVLGNEFEFVALEKEAWLDMRLRYIEMSRAGTLPEAKPIVLHHIVDKTEEQKPKLNDAQQAAIDMFGDLVEFEE